MDKIDGCVMVCCVKGIICKVFFGSFLCVFFDVCEIKCGIVVCVVGMVCCNVFCNFCIRFDMMCM